MTTTHTPGPWTKDDNGEVDTSSADLSLWDGVLASDGVVAYCHADNASLISAAPDMLEALRALVAPYAGVDPSGFAPDVCQSLTAARSAIAKATGQS